MVEVYDHVRGEGGVYRVVGVSEDALTLLRLTDGGRRRATGEVVTVSREDLSSFEPAANPDAGFRPVGWVRNLVSGMVWEFRALTGI